MFANRSSLTLASTIRFDAMRWAIGPSEAKNITRMGKHLGDSAVKGGIDRHPGQLQPLCLEGVFEA